MDDALSLARSRAGAQRGTMQTSPICLFDPIEVVTNIGYPKMRVVRVAVFSLGLLVCRN